jgi:hypothetical protein
MVTFVWKVPTAGFCWQEAQDWWAKELTGAKLSPHVLMTNDGQPWRDYEPLRDVPDLFRIFAGLASTEAAMQQFANQYGNLGIERKAVLSDGRQVLAESWMEWEYEQYVLRVAIQVSEALKSGNHAQLERWFTWEWLNEETGSKRAVFRPDDAIPSHPYIHGANHGRILGVSIAGEAMREHATQWWMWRRTDPSDMRHPPSDPVELALATLRDWINNRLEKHAAPRLEYVDRQKDRVPLRLVTAPRTLFGAMWLQFTQELEGHLRYERCHQCQTWFRVNPKANRPSTRFCRDSCRVKAHRQRHPGKKVAASR